MPRHGRIRWHCVTEDEELKTIPTAILTTSEAESDIRKSYEPNANCYLAKSVHMDAFEAP